MDELIKAVKSLLIDIESMQNKTVPNSTWFGDFSEYEDNPNGVLIEWPNLAIQAAVVKEALKNHG